MLLTTLRGKNYFEVSLRHSYKLQSMRKILSDNSTFFNLIFASMRDSSYIKNNRVASGYYWLNNSS